MNLKKIVAISVLPIVLAPIVFAETQTGSVSEGQEISYRLSPEFSGIDQFLRTNLSNTEESEIRSIYDNFTELLLERSAVPMRNCKSQLQDELNRFNQSLVKFIDPKKTFAYREYVLRNTSVREFQMNETWLGYGKCTIDLEKTYKRIPLLKDEMKSKIDAKIEKIAPEKRIEFIQKLIKYLDKVSKSKNSPKIKRLISEMKDYLNGKIEELEFSDLLPEEKDL